MSKFGSKEEILSAIQALFENIQSGSLTADEMESLVELTRELHERTLILRYKSYEEKIFGIAPENTEEQREEAFEEMEVETENTEISEERPMLAFEEVDEEILEHEKLEVVNDEPVFDFDMFEKAEEKAAEEADMFSKEIIVEPAPELEPSIFEEPIAEELYSEPEISEPLADEFLEVENTPVFSEPEPTIFDEPITAELYSELEISEPLADEFLEVENTPVFSEPEPTIFDEPIAAVLYSEPEISEPFADEFLDVENTPVFSEPEPIVGEAADVNTDIFNRYSNTSDDSLSARLMSMKLQTLVGSFGLNDKLQCIRQLFGGSSEAFNQSIEQLDNQIDFTAAKRILAQLAQQFSWDLESNLTAEFIQKVERRYL